MKKKYRIISLKLILQLHCLGYFSRCTSVCACTCIIQLETHRGLDLEGLCTKLFRLVTLEGTELCEEQRMDSHVMFMFLHYLTFTHVIRYFMILKNDTWKISALKRHFKSILSLRTTLEDGRSPFVRFKIYQFYPKLAFWLKEITKFSEKTSIRANTDLLALR